MGSFCSWCHLCSISTRMGEGFAYGCLCYEVAPLTLRAQLRAQQHIQVSASSLKIIVGHVTRGNSPCNWQCNIPCRLHCSNFTCNAQLLQTVMQQNVALRVARKVELSSTFKQRCEPRCCVWHVKRSLQHNFTKKISSACVANCEKICELLTPCLQLAMFSLVIASCSSAGHWAVTQLLAVTQCIQEKKRFVTTAQFKVSYRLLASRSLSVCCFYVAGYEDYNLRFYWSNFVSFHKTVVTHVAYRDTWGGLFPGSYSRSWY